VDAATAIAVSRRGELPADAAPVPLVRDDETRYEAVDAAPEGGTILLAEPVDGGWEAAADGVPLQLRAEGSQMRFDLDGPASYVLVAHDDQSRRTGLVLLQLFFLTVAVSLMLRPPRFAQEGSR
jgi:hypothetical protein